MRSRRPADTRRRILEAAVAEFADKGLAGARVDAIAARAGANKRMIYQYFGNKQDLWLVALENVYEAMRTEERLLHVTDLDPVEGMRRLVEFNFRFSMAHPELISLLNNENLHQARHLRRSKKVPALHSPLLAMIDEVLARGVAQGVFRPGVDPMQLYITIAALGYFFLSNTHTLSTIFRRDLSRPKARRERQAHIVEVVLGYLRP
ncbi:MAG: TetR family transcriptional regulator [Alphaproteobacteria bacterium]|nr:TetR family transcriptional regulator [Alphaproteobacteria bacterium]